MNILKKIVQLKHHSGFRKYFANTSWLLGERVLRMAVSLFVGIYVARYLGPERFGLLSYANSYVGIFTAIAILGLDGIVVRELVKSPDQRDTLLGTSFLLKVVGTLLMWVLILATLFFSNNDPLTSALIAIIAFGVLFQTFNVIDYNFQAEVKSKYVVHSQIVQLIVSSITKLVLILKGLPLVWFAAVYSLDAIILAVGLAYAYSRNSGSIKKWKWNAKVALALLLDSWPLMFAYMSYLIYAKIDRIMIKEMLDEHNVGIYSAAYILYEAPLFISLMIAKSVYPILVQYYQDNKNKFFQLYSTLSSYMTLLSYLIVLFIFIFHEILIQITFGESFEESSKILMLLSFGMIPMFNAFLRSSYITISGNQKIILYTSLFSAMLNIVLNLSLIKAYGVIGAVYATVFTQTLSLIVLNFAFTNTRSIFFIQAKSLLLFGIWRKFNV
jgi:O-antigen/teichoic acid export membrane protein